MVSSAWMLRRRMTTLNMSSQTVHRFGFIRLGLMPNRRKGRDRGPRIGTGTCIWDQHPLQIIACGMAIETSLGQRYDPTRGGAGKRRATDPSLGRTYRIIAPL